MASPSDEEAPIKIIKTYSRQDKSSYYDRSPNNQRTARIFRSPTITIGSSSYFDRLPGNQSTTNSPKRPSSPMGSKSFLDRLPNNQSTTSSPKIPTITIGSKPFYDRSPSSQPTTSSPRIPTVTIGPNSGCSYGRHSNNRLTASLFKRPTVTIGASSPGSLTVGELSDNERIFNAKIIIYPEGDQVRDQLSITSTDLDCLNKYQMLNDNIVYFYLKYLTLEKIEINISCKLHLFNTFFYSKLSQLKTSTDDIRRWIKNVDIFEKDFLVIPICDQIHWFLLIVCYAGEVPGRDDPITIHDDPESWNPKTDNPRVPAIIILDSLGRNRRSYTKHVREFLQYESDKRNPSCKEYSREHIKDICAQVPTQTNSYDCGIYILQYFEEFFREPVKNYIQMYQNRDMSDWFDRTTISRKRRNIRELIDEKQSKQANKIRAILIK